MRGRGGGVKKGPNGDGVFVYALHYTNGKLNVSSDLLRVLGFNEIAAREKSYFMRIDP